MLAAGIMIALAISMMAFIGCSSNPTGNDPTKAPENPGGVQAGRGGIPEDINIDISDDGALKDSNYCITIRDGKPWLLGYYTNGDKIIEQQLPDEFLDDINLIRVKLWDAEKLRITCLGYTETLEEWNDLSQKSRGKLPCLYYYQSAGVYCMFNSTYNREYSVIDEEGNGIFVGFDDVYMTYTPGSGETMSGGFDATHLNIMEGETLKESIMNNYSALESHDMEPVL